MANFTGNNIKDTYQRIVQVFGDELRSGLGNSFTGSLTLSSSLITLGTGSSIFSGPVTMSGAVDVGGVLEVAGATTLKNNTTITGSLVVTEDITARSLITQLTQSTVLFRSGSTKFGNTDDDTHEFTGSLSVLGSSKLLGNYSVTGSINHSGSLTSEGTHQVKEGAYGAFFANPQTFDRDITIPANYNSRLFGPITVAAGKILTVEANAKLEITDI